ncbi:unnamed protein product [Rangifer tarandus platyrhynchus]|uniref:Uncharacterized protein n=1 Tax=Rangifer tarandus platyrhynchus TaxID=3082113 RepID=A0AC59YFR5_RANTA
MESPTMEPSTTETPTMEPAEPGSLPPHGAPSPRSHLTTEALTTEPPLPQRPSPQSPSLQCPPHHGAPHTMEPAEPGSLPPHGAPSPRSHLTTEALTTEPPLPQRPSPQSPSLQCPPHHGAPHTREPPTPGSPRHGDPQMQVGSHSSGGCSRCWRTGEEHGRLVASGTQKKAQALEARPKVASPGLACISRRGALSWPFYWTAQRKNQPFPRCLVPPGSSSSNGPGAAQRDEGPGVGAPGCAPRYTGTNCVKQMHGDESLWARLHP